jgi:sodium/potassium-transporting ATPase subunit beta
VDIKSWAPCVQENHYSYHKSSPCIFLKLNKIFGWVPHFYNDSEHLPSNMPKDLQTFIKDTSVKEPHTVSDKVPNLFFFLQFFFLFFR